MTQNDFIESDGRIRLVRRYLTCQVGPRRVERANVNLAKLSASLKAEDVAEIFKAADKDNSGSLTVKEIQDVLEDIYRGYPQIKLYLKSRHMSSILELLEDSKGNGKKEAIEVNIEEFKKALADVDSQVKALPATAQVAAQQGNYLAKCFNKMKDTEEHSEGPLLIRESGRHQFHPFRSHYPSEVAFLPPILEGLRELLFEAF
ncbi:hypothetical protein KSP40_PGU019540 [Platanthera guangdongensis]|uniref:NADH:ubiquinone reductase (non-electrogenic) n=1 Tax=Platanthera guangdongensis TaxID=2320717 RepID=A0ABR2N3W0_9ASPA